MFDQHLPVPRSQVHQGFRGTQGDVGWFFTCACWREVSGKDEGAKILRLLFGILSNYSYLCSPIAKSHI